MIGIAVAQIVIGRLIRRCFLALPRTYFDISGIKNLVRQIRMINKRGALFRFSRVNHISVVRIRQNRLISIKRISSNGHFHRAVTDFCFSVCRINALTFRPLCNNLSAILNFNISAAVRINSYKFGIDLNTAAIDHNIA